MTTVICLFVHTENIAKNKPATQSSTDNSGSAARAVDGNTASSWSSRSCTHTNTEYAWWRVDLGNDFDISGIKITNRGDCCETRLRLFEIRIGNNPNGAKENQL